MQHIALDKFLRRALEEDLGGFGDITTGACVPPHTQVQGRFIAKEEGILCGMELLPRIFAVLDPAVVVTARVSDGDRVEPGTVVAEIQGPAGPILSGERLALNLLCRLSGIATKTADLAAQVAGTKAKICDTRKTTPGLRVLEKYAVKTGGGYNHRFGLFDGVLIKDNHIVAAGGISPAIQAVGRTVPHTIQIEVETETLDQVQEALEAGADIIMLDNMDIPAMEAAVRLIDGRALTEASGNMDEKDLKAVAGTGVDFISVGALTHSVRILDISLKFQSKSGAG